MYMYIVLTMCKYNKKNRGSLSSVVWGGRRYKYHNNKHEMCQSNALISIF